MTSANKLFLFGHLAITGLIITVVVLAHYLTQTMMDMPINAGATLWAAIITTLAYAITTRSLHGSGGEFSNAVMISMMMKMMLSLGFIGLILYLTHVERKGFIASYFSAFFLMGFFEVYCLLNNLRPK